MENTICECGNVFAPAKCGNSEQMCKSCVSNRRRYQMKLRCIDYLGGKCSACGVIGCPEIYDFHHIDPTTKKFTISGKMSHSWKFLRDELDKCSLLCANCHRTFHFEEKSHKTYRLSYESVKLPNKKQEAIRTRKIDRSQQIIQQFGHSLQKSDGKRELYVWPSVDEVVELVKDTSFKRASEIMGVTDNAIRKFLRRHEIDPKSIRNIKNNSFTKQAPVV